MASLGGMCVGPERDGTYLPLDPYEAYAKGAAKDIEFLQGINKDELNYFLVIAGGVEPFVKYASNRMKENFAVLTEEEKARVESFCKDIKGESYEPYVRLYDQIWFIAPLFRLTENQTKAGGKSYNYYFTVESSVFSKTMRKMWVQFAKTGNPSLSAEISPDGKAHEWPLYDLENKGFMVLDEFDIHPAKESELKLLDWERCYFLTKYFCL